MGVPPDLALGKACPVTFTAGSAISVSAAVSAAGAVTVSWERVGSAA